MTGLELLIGAGAIAGKEALKKALDSLYDASAEEAKKALRILKTDRQLRKLLRQLSKVRQVKTLGQLDKAVDLTTFYCDSHIYKNKLRKKIEFLSDFNSNGNILIEGIAGQGKSIFLRYLCGIEAIRGEVLPIFAELRKIQEGQSLANFLVKTLNNFHVEADDKTFNALADSGKLVILLDAFDEVRDDSKDRVLNELEIIVEQHESLRLIITSRPDSGIAISPHFDVVKLSDLEGEEWTIVIDKITEDTELAAALIKQVIAHKGGIQQLLLTPLLVTLLVIRYKSFQELPEQLADFYDSLFQVLLQRHDGTKPGYRRARSCVLNDHEYRSAFEAFCFFSKKFQEKPFGEIEVHEAAKVAFKDATISADPSSFISDIVKITCLLVHDGEEYRFIHKSVQEYYAAAYIKRKPDIVAEQLYRKLFDNGSWWRFAQELAFLETIDTYRYGKYGVLPYLSRLFSIEAREFLAKPSEKDITTLRDLFAATRFTFTRNGNRLVLHSINWPRFGPLSGRIIEPMEHFFLHTVPKAVTDSPFQSSTTSSSSIDVLFGTLIEAYPILKSEMQKALSQLAHRLYLVGKEMLNQVKREEKIAAIYEILE